MLDIGFKYKVYNPYVVASLAVMGGLLFGFDISSMSSMMTNSHYVAYFGKYDATEGKVAMGAMRQAGVTASMAGGSFLGSLVSGPTCDRVGRKPVQQAAAIMWVIGAAIQCSSINITQLILGRIIAGFGVGFCSSQVPVYVAEMSPKKLRGTLVGLFQWFTTWGILIMFYIGFGCSQIKSNAAFRATWGIQMVPGALFFLGTLFLTESPRWLAAHGQWDEAARIISKIQAKGDLNNEIVRIELEEIKEAVRIEQSSNFKFFDLFRTRTNLRRTLVGMSCQMWQQLTGMNVDMYYITTIFAFAGYSGNSNLVASSIQYVINTVMTIPALLFIDRWGRRRVMYYGAFIMMVWMVAMAAVLGKYSVHLDHGLNGDPQVRIQIPSNEKSASRAVIAISYLFVATFAPTWGPAGWIYCSEIFPLHQRAQANALCAAVNWIFNMSIALFTPAAFVNITWRTYIIFAAFCFAMCIHVFLMYPETHGLSLEEVGELWDADIPAWRTTNWQPSTPRLIAENGVSSLKETGNVEHVDNFDEKSETSAEAL